MRMSFIHTLMELAERDDRILLLTGDLGFNVMEPFVERFPHRFFNVGVAEQNMLGVATGLAEAGFLPFVYSIATFASMRPYEVTRCGPVLHRLPVRIVGVGGGFEYGHAGPTHYALEDLAIMRTQPGLAVMAPADHEQARSALLATWDLPGPVYYRLGKDDKFTVPGLHGRFDMDSPQVACEGRDGVFVVTGAIAGEVVAAADALAQHGLSYAVAIVPVINPAPGTGLLKLLRSFHHVITVEAHYVNGGLGSLVAECIAENGLPCRLVRCGVRSLPHGACGGQAYMEALHGLSADALVKTALAQKERRELPCDHKSGAGLRESLPVITTSDAGHD